MLSFIPGAFAALWTIINREPESDNIQDTKRARVSKKQPQKRQTRIPKYVKLTPADDGEFLPGVIFEGGLKNFGKHT